MARIDLSWPDRQVGVMLSGEEVERLREAIVWIRNRRGMRLKEIALGCNAPEHTIRNFAHRRSIRPDNSVLGRLYKFFASNSELLPENFLAAGGTASVGRLDDELGRDDLMKLIKLELPISEGDLKRVFDRYSGYYLCFRQSYRPARLSVAWLHILPLPANLDTSKAGLPLPRFTLFIKYSDQIDPSMTRSHIVAGYALSRNGRVFLIGHRDGELNYLTLNEPPTARFTYLRGLSLMISAVDKQPFSTRVVCQYLGPGAERADWEDKVGVFSDQEFRTLFDNAEVIARAISGCDVLTAGDLDTAASGSG